MRSDDSLLARLKRRKLFQWALAYLAGAWLVFQGIEVLAEPWNLSEAVQRTIHVLLGIGFLVTLVLAWYHGEKGRQRASGVELLILAGILVIAGAAVAVLGRGSQDRSAGEYEAPASTLDEMSIAVLPFANRSELQADEYFTDGMHDEILTRLFEIRALSVRGRTSVMQYRDSPQNLRAIGRELNARYILEGGVQRAGGTVRINLQLVDAESDEHIWAETFDRPLTVENLLGVQSEVALRVAEALKATLTAEEAARIERRPTENMEAYNLFLLGRFWWNKRDRDGLLKAVEYFQQAVQKDSSFALGYAGLADSYFLLGYWDRASWSREEVIPRVRSAALEALEKDSDLAEAYTALGGLTQYYDWDWAGAEELYQRAIALKPSYATAHHRYAILLDWLGRHEESIVEFERAHELDPLSPVILNAYGVSLRGINRYDEAVEQLQRALDIAPDIRFARENLGRLYLEQGRYEQAIAVLPPDDAHLTAAYLALGRTQEAEAVFEQAMLSSSYSRLVAYVGFGQLDAAFEVLEQMHEQRDILLPETVGYNHAYFRVLQSDPRYDRYRRATGLP